MDREASCRLRPKPAAAAAERSSARQRPAPCASAANLGHAARGSLGRVEAAALAVLLAADDERAAAGDGLALAAHDAPHLGRRGFRVGARVEARGVHCAMCILHRALCVRACVCVCVCVGGGGISVAPPTRARDRQPHLPPVLVDEHPARGGLPSDRHVVPPAVGGGDAGEVVGKHALVLHHRHAPA